jgi:trans-2,3-dihydro-3-hydroxyanthranilate isomerase
MRLRFYTADVFTDRIFGGNPLAVFPDAAGLSAKQMQRIAREFNLSESVFVLPPGDPDHTRRLRIFTPETELPFAGHPTIGAAHVLAAIGEIDVTGSTTQIVFEEAVGPVPVRVQAENGQPVFAELSAAEMPEFGPEPPPVDAIAEILAIRPSDVRTDRYVPQAVSCGVPFLFVPLRDRDALARAQVDRARWTDVLSAFWAPHLYCVAVDPEQPDGDLRARMFAPAMGIDEDPATGAAATALAGYLTSHTAARSGTVGWTIEQGVEMGRPSVLHVEAEVPSDAIEAIRVGGTSVLVTEGAMNVPDTIPT